MVRALTGRKALVAKLGMDAHWRGAIVVANGLREAGMEVVYLGHAIAEELARAAAQEDAVLIGLSTLSGNHMSEVPRTLAALREHGLDDVVVVVGGTVPAADADALREAGVADVFGTDSTLATIVPRVAELVSVIEEERAAGAL